MIDRYVAIIPDPDVRVILKIDGNMADVASAIGYYCATRLSYDVCTTSVIPCGFGGEYEVTVFDRRGNPLVTCEAIPSNAPWD